MKRAKACTTGDIAKAVCRYLRLPEDYPVEYIGARPGEKMHEALLTEEEAEMAEMRGDFIVVQQGLKPPTRLTTPYKSNEAERMSEDDVLNLIQSVFDEGDGRK